MIGLVKWLHVVGVATWLGSVVFCSFVVAPSVFGAFPADQRAEAGRVMSAIFPRYYLLGYVCGAILVVCAALLWRANGGVVPLLGGAVAAAMLAATVWAGAIVQPRIHALRPQLHRPDTPVDVQVEFDALHRASVRLNVAVLVGGLALAGLTAATLRP